MRANEQRETPPLRPSHQASRTGTRQLLVHPLQIMAPARLLPASSEMKPQSDASLNADAVPHLARSGIERRALELLGH
eukprot:2216028-Prymnesium_polylepis.1